MANARTRPDQPARHPLNVGFEWQRRPPPHRHVTAEQAESFDELGYFLIPDAFDPDTVAALVAEVDPFEREFEEALRASTDGRAFIARVDEITFTVHLVTRSPWLRTFASHPRLVGLCRDLIGPDVRLYWDQAVYKKPGTAASFPWHQDNGYSFVEPQQYLTCWIALTDATEANGCPWVVPGLHRLGTLRHELTDTGLVCLTEAPDAVAVAVPAGGMVVFSSLTPHCTGPNRTDEVRKSYIVQYAPDGAVVQHLPDRDAAPTPADAPDRQFLILSGGQPIT